MLPLDTLIAFFGIAVLLALTPGPDNLFVLMQSAIWGRKAGMFVVLGLCTGLLGHTAAVAVGLAAVFAASPVAFTVLKLAGAAYLAYLAWQILRAPVESEDGKRPEPMRPGALYRRGIVMNLTNPKVLLFFFAFLPQFTSGRWDCRPCNWARYSSCRRCWCSARSRSSRARLVSCCSARSRPSAG
jgi:threonine/homoserine/homoserine lactone efflux protein